MIIGYTTGVFDLFHIGHLRMLSTARTLCNHLIVGVTVDELVQYKHKKSVIPFDERLAVVSALKCVDTAVPQYSLDKYEAWKKIKYNVLFVGDDWYNAGDWPELELKLSKHNVKVTYLPYTRSTSSTLINETLLNLRRAPNDSP